MTNTWIYNYENDINEFGSVHGFRHTLEVMGGILHSKGRPLCLGSLAEFFFHMKRDSYLALQKENLQWLP